jgi:Stage II sporulation protein E (SpoIIE)
VVPVPGKSANEKLASQVVGGPGHSLSQRIQLLLAHHAVGADEEAPGRRLFYRIRAWLRSRSTVAQSSPPGLGPRLAPLMYATLALLRFDGSAEAEYALAGHVPILHYRDRSRDTVRLSMEQFPLGLIPGGCYASQRVTYLSRDLFLMLTDGISEVPNERDEEFGLARLEQLLTQYAAQPLPHIWGLIMEQVHQHGLQQDDQTLLLVRVRH